MFWFQSNEQLQSVSLCFNLDAKWFNKHLCVFSSIAQSFAVNYKESRPRNLGRGVSKPKKNTVASLLAQSRAVGLKPMLSTQQLLSQGADFVSVHIFFGFPFWRKTPGYWGVFLHCIRWLLVCTNIVIHYACMYFSMSVGKNSSSNCRSKFGYGCFDWFGECGRHKWSVRFGYRRAISKSQRFTRSARQRMETRNNYPWPNKEWSNSRRCILLCAWNHRQT